MVVVVVVGGGLMEIRLETFHLLVDLVAGAETGLIPWRMWCFESFVIEC